MKILSVRLAYFSPTGTTRTVIEHIAQGIGIEVVEALNFNSPQSGVNDYEVIDKDTLLVIGAPVYAGRIPPIAIERFQCLKANGAPVVLVVLYGNREFEDALLEFSDFTVSAGFVPIAGGAFIGEHSFSTPSVPLSKGRPDREDIRRAREFGGAIRDYLRNLRNVRDIRPPEFPGNRPFKEHPEFPAISPVTDSTRCTACGVCIEACPSESIAIESMSETNAATCILCCACIKTCPENARGLEDPFARKIIEWLSANTMKRKEPEVFWAPKRSDVP